MNRNILLLNADMSALNFISFPRVIGLYIQDKISIVETDNKGEFVHPRIKIKYPKKVALKKYIYVPYKKPKICRKNIFLRDKFICQYCGHPLREKDATIDHVIPKSNANFPGNTWTNLVTSCIKCNNKKDNKTPKEAGMKLLNVPKEPKLEDLVTLTSAQ